MLVDRTCEVMIWKYDQQLSGDYIFYNSSLFSPLPTILVILIMFGFNKKFAVLEYLCLKATHSYRIFWSLKAGWMNSINIYLTIYFILPVKLSK